jgi:hypothetical protein
MNLDIKTKYYENGIFFWFLFPIVAIGQTSTENFIKHQFIKVATVSYYKPNYCANSIQNVTYFDGVGRPIQQLMHNLAQERYSNLSNDGFGRQVKEYLLMYLLALPFENTNQQL